MKSNISSFVEPGTKDVPFRISALHPSKNYVYHVDFRAFSKSFNVPWHRIVLSKATNTSNILAPKEDSVEYRNFRLFRVEYFTIDRNETIHSFSLL